MVKSGDNLLFKNDFVYSNIVMTKKVLRQIIKVGKGSKGLVTHAHKHGAKVFFTVHINKPKNIEIINISPTGKASKTKKFDLLFADIAKEDVEKIKKGK